MMHAWRTWIGLPALMLLGTAGCGTTDTTEVPPIETGLSVSGLTFTLSGAALIGVSVLSDATSSFFATAATVAVVSGTRTSKTATLSLQAVSN